MKSQRNIARLLFGLTLTLVGLMSWNTLLIHLPERAVQAATRAKVTEPTGQPVSRAAANGRIAFVSLVNSIDGNNTRSDIYTMEADSSDRKQLTFSPMDSESEPVWSPDGTKIAFSRWNINSRFVEIFVMNADGSDQRRLTQSREDHSPSWSPDGTKIAFWGTFEGGGCEIFVMNADGSDQRAVGSGFGVAWSPDGLKLAVADSGYLGIYLINVDGSNRTQITQPPDVWSGDWDPAWSPDGSKITFTRGADCFFGDCDNQHLWVVNADGSNATQLTDVLAYDSAWSPDGTKIIFAKGQNCFNNYNCVDLFVMNPDGSGLTNITNTPDRLEYSPSWQPISSSACTNPIDCAAFIRAANAASYSTVALAPDSIASIFGSNLATSEKPAETTTLPTSLAGTTVNVIDSANVERLAPLFYVSPRQINLLIPPGTAPGKARLLVTAGDGALALGEIMIQSVSPGLFAANADGAGAGAAYVVRVKADGTQIYEQILQLDAGLGRYVAIPIDLGPAGETVFLVMHGTGVRGAAHGTVRAQIGGGGSSGELRRTAARLRRARSAQSDDSAFARRAP